MPRVKNREFWESALMNNYTFKQYYERLMGLAISMFEWKNLPDSVDERYLELTLFAKGYAVFFKDEDLDDYLALPSMIGGKWNVYQIPIDRVAYATNGYNKKLTNEDSVLIYNNMIHTNSMLDVEQFAKRLYNLDRAIDVNANAQKTPVLILADETQRLTMKNLYMQYEGNYPFIFGDKGLNFNDLKVLKTDAPYVADKLYQLKTQLWNEALTYLGISNLNIQKKERLVADEVTRNLGGTIANRYARLNARRKACDEINKMFGLNIECDFREDYREADDEVMFAGDSGDNGMSNLAIDLRTR